MNKSTLVKITSRAWALPILASLHTGTPGRQAPLINATGASRTAFTQSLSHLINLGLIERNPGHGHPLRPEFRLTKQGATTALLAHKIQSLISQENQHTLLRKSWTIPVLACLHQPTAFSTIKRTLPTISDRALSQSLRALESSHWANRSILPESRPPKPIYLATNTGAQIAKITHAAIS